MQKECLKSQIGFRGTLMFFFIIVSVFLCHAPPAYRRQHPGVI